MTFWDRFVEAYVWFDDATKPIGMLFVYIVILFLRICLAPFKGIGELDIIASMVLGVPINQKSMTTWI